MKQNITPEQLMQLSHKGREKLQEMWIPQEGDWIAVHQPYKQRSWNVELNAYDSFGKIQVIPGTKAEGEIYPLPSIGQMIEILAKGSKSYYLPGCTIGESEINPQTWCDDLWEAVKTDLEKE